MPVFETFAKRRRRSQESGKPTIYRYDVLPQEFRVQVAYIWQDVEVALRGYQEQIQWWRSLHDAFARELGVFALGPHTSNMNFPALVGRSGGNIYWNNCEHFLMNDNDVNQVLSLIEIVFGVVNFEIGQLRETNRAPWIGEALTESLEELNSRFKEHSLGYQFEGGKIIEVTSQYLHSEAIEPAIALMHNQQFEGALQEFMNAHKHYRRRNNKEAIAEASKAFESTMKTICERRNWDCPPDATASKLISILFDKELVPPQMQSHFSSLRSTLESGLPTVRNRMGGHGQGRDPVEAPDYLAEYALHLTASNIVFLINADKSQ